jgi:hypothetical protein
VPVSLKVLSWAVSVALVSPSAAAKDPQKISALTPWTEVAVPTLEKLCGNPKEKSIRKRVKTFRVQTSGNDFMGPSLGSDLVPCGHGLVRFVQFSISKQDILVVAEEDRRPSYRSGGSRYRGFGLVGDTIVRDQDALWKSIPHKKELSQEQIVKLLAATILLQARPEIVLTSEQKEIVVAAWPKTESAFSQNPPGLYKADADLPVLQAWITHKYSERGVSCRYIEGWRATFDQTTGLQLVRNHDYAAGNNIGRPCGNPLPGGTK